MDILCTRCGEPWDITSLTDDMTQEEAEKLKAGRGCPCCAEWDLCQLDIPCENCQWYSGGKRFACDAGKFKPRADDARHIQRELAGILGDDIDGLAAMMDDAGLI